MLTRFTLLIMLFVSANIFAQKSGDDIVILKSGEKIYGKIIERTEGVSVKIETVKKNVRVEAWADIDKITKQDPEAVNWQKQLKYHNALRKLQAKGFVGELSFAGVSYFDKSAFYSINASIGYQFNPYFALMAGGGGELNGNTQFVPVFGQVRINFLPRNYSPFFYAQGGYAFGFRKEPYTTTYATSLTISRPGDKGVYVNTGVGFRYMLAKHFGFSVKAGFRMQQLNGTKEESYYSNWGYNFTRTVDYSRIIYGFNVAAGLEF